jgi:hypothetical protein
MERMATDEDTFTSPQRTTGWVGLATMIVLLVVTLSDGTGLGHLALASAVLLYGAITVAVFLRPAVVVEDDHLLVRNSLTDVVVPWPAIRGVALRYVMELDVGDRVVRAVAFGRTPRQMRHQARNVAGVAEVDYTSVVMNRLREVAAKKGGLRASAGTEPVTTTWRWAEVAVVAALGVLTVVLVVLAAA